MDLFFLLIIFIFVVGPIIEKVMKGGAAQRPPQGGVPGQRPPPRRIEQRFPQMPTQQRGEGSGAGEDATDMLPSELWEMLTGQRPSSTEGMRTRPLPKETPAPAPARSAPVRPPPERQGRLSRPTARESARTSTAPPPAPLRDDLAEADALIRRRELEEQARRALHRGGPEIVSLETAVQSEQVRHKAFHRKLEHEAPPATVDKPSGPRLRMDQLGTSDLMRAVLLQEILGPPKGMEE